MKFPYHVKHNGVNYAPYEEIDMDDKPIEEKAVNEPSGAKEIIPQNTNFPYTRTQVTVMRNSEIKKIAAQYGCDSSLTGNEIKKFFIEKYNL